MNKVKDVYYIHSYDNIIFLSQHSYIKYIVFLNILLSLQMHNNNGWTFT